MISDREWLRASGLCSGMLDTLPRRDRCDTGHFIGIDEKRVAGATPPSLGIPTVLIPLTRLMWVYCQEPTPCYQYRLGPINFCPLGSLETHRFPRQLTVTSNGKGFGGSFDHVLWLSELPPVSSWVQGRRWGCGVVPRDFEVCHQPNPRIFPSAVRGSPLIFRVLARD
ncbi:hypothetical protein BDV38DRAFT_3169 [Aspergillus pseudotamarii]|uniref:Uncharacterized protein n=1 Tax=Aspergillus pseudotamarii TaxID=132259 RepID=A0A5N6TC91_ASPPS|nr:uncharacterized protein BDV38DRAFT_3169 [Aspergillus pseudotamarii]KAE8143779.1 hypothetical protein BDV38DRAFT_3169 [Aspergillus pseudotamarii]